MLYLGNIKGYKTKIRMCWKVHQKRWSYNSSRDGRFCEAPSVKIDVFYIPININYPCALLCRIIFTIHCFPITIPITIAKKIVGEITITPSSSSSISSPFQTYKPSSTSARCLSESLGELTCSIINMRKWWWLRFFLGWFSHYVKFCNHVFVHLKDEILLRPHLVLMST